MFNDPHLSPNTPLSNLVKLIDDSSELRQKAIEALFQRTDEESCKEQKLRLFSLLQQTPTEITKVLSTKQIITSINYSYADPMHKLAGLALLGKCNSISLDHNDLSAAWELAFNGEEKERKPQNY